MLKTGMFIGSPVAAALTLGAGLAAADIISNVTKRPVKNYVDWAFTNKDNDRDPNAMTNVARAQGNFEDLHKLGVSPMTIDVGKYVDMSIAREAAKRLEGI